MAEPTVEEFKNLQRRMWAAGDYAELSQHIEHVGQLAVQRAGVQAGQAVLDVACGAGNVALPAAVAGARVTGLDLVPALLEAGRKKADAAGVAIEWVEGDAEAMPFDDASFDLVFSTFGHMFAPRHAVTAAEMTRVCRPGGSIVVCCWTPQGTVGAVFAAGSAFMPPPPSYADPPVLWGTREHVRQMFGAAAADMQFEEHSATVEWSSVDGFADYFMDRFPMMVAARGMLGERFADLRVAVLDVWRKTNTATDGTFRLPQEYLMSIIRRT